MVTIAEALAIGTRHQLAGQLAEAEQIYRQILAADPRNGHALHNLGVLCMAAGRLPEAVDLITSATRSDPSQPAFHANLGEAWRLRGDLEQAVACCRRAVKLKPDFAEGHNNLGNALQDQGKFDEAADCYRRALKLKPNLVDVRNNLCESLRRAGKVEQAVACCRKAIALKPDFAGAHNNLGNALLELGQLDEAIAAYRRALELAPGLAMAYNNLGNALDKQGQLDEAVACCRKAIELKPDFAGAYNNLGNALQQQGQLDEAVACYRRALELNPDFAGVQENLTNALQEKDHREGAAVEASEQANSDRAAAENNLGNVLREQGKIDEAIACYRRAIELKPQFAGALTNLGNLLQTLGELDEAVACHRRAIELEPGYAAAHSNLGNTLQVQGYPDQAMACYARALELQPDYPEVHVNMAMALLVRGRLLEGWAEYEWRWKYGNFGRIPSPQPLWTGEPLPGGRILLCTEQGMGDCLQFVRYAPLVKQRCAQVIVACEAPVARLVATCPGVDSVIVHGQGDVEHDVQVPLMSLPGIFQTALDSIPAQVPYLFPSTELIVQREAELGPRRGLRVGIAWQGNRAYRNDRFRSIPFAKFAGIVRTEGAQVFSLQVGDGREQLTAMDGQLPITDLADRLGDFHDTAALVKNLDLVITSDSASAHLAGALGVRVWMAVSTSPDWRWLMNRADSPWYPTMRLFRQSRQGDWDTVFVNIERELAHWIAQSRSS